MEPAGQMKDDFHPISAVPFPESSAENVKPSLTTALQSSRKNTDKSSRNLNTESQ